MGNNTPLSFKSAFLLLLFLASVPLSAQTDPDKIEKSDSIVNSTADLKMEVLTLKNKVVFLEGKVRSLRGNISVMSTKVKNLTEDNEKTSEQYDELERYAKQILESNDSLRTTNRNLESANLQIKGSKASIEIAANALSDVLDNERIKSRAVTESFKKNYSRKCTDITHSTRKGEVVLDAINTHKLAWIDDFNLTVSTCYAMPRELASNNIRVYFYLFKEKTETTLEPLENSIPIILTPNLEASDEAIVYYDGTLTVALPTSNRKSLKSNFVYEVAFQEEIIASGSFRLD